MPDEKPEKQIEKFRRTAVELETDPSEEAFTEIVKKIARQSTQSKEKPT